MASLTGCKQSALSGGSGPFKSGLDMSVDAILDLEFESELPMPDNNDYAKLLIAMASFTEDHNSLSFGGGYTQGSNDGLMRYMYAYTITFQKDYIREEDSYSYLYPDGSEYRSTDYFYEMGFKKGKVYEHGQYYDYDEEYDIEPDADQEEFEASIQDSRVNYSRYMSYSVEQVVYSTINNSSFKYGKIAGGYYAISYSQRNHVLDTYSYQYHGEYYDGHTFENFANIVILDKKSDGSFKLLSGYSGYEVYTDVNNNIPLEEPKMTEFECSFFLGKTDNTDYLGKLVSSMPKVISYISFYITPYEFLYTDNQNPEKPTEIMPTENPSHLSVTTIGEYKFVMLPTISKNTIFTISYEIDEYKLIDGVYVETEELYTGFVSELDFPYNIELEKGTLPVSGSEEDAEPVPYFIYHNDSSINNLAFQYQFKKSGNNYKVSLSNPVFLSMY